MSLIASGEIIAANEVDGTVGLEVDGTVGLEVDNTKGRLVQNPQSSAVNDTEFELETEPSFDDTDSDFGDDAEFDLNSNSSVAFNSQNSLKNLPTADEQGYKGRFWGSWKKVVNVFRKVIAKETSENRDPWESWNRKVYVFNDVADQWVLTPVARSYQWVTPDPLEKGVQNVFSNLLDVNVIFNDLLQFKLGQAVSDTGRFLINTTVGVGGLFDVASPMGLTKHQEDFGQTLGKWGVSSGPYVVIPFLGPSTIRSGIGTVVDSRLDPVNFISHIPTRNQIWIFKQIQYRAALFSAESLITGDRYTFIRDAYLQHRDFLVNDGVLEDTFGDEDFDDEDFDDWDEEE